MKLCVFLMLWFSWGLSASVSAQQERVNLDLKNVSLNVLCGEIQRQTNLYFVFNTEQIRQLGPVSVKATNETVEEVLRRILVNTGMTFELNGNLIVICPVAEDEKNKKGPEKFTITGVVKDADGITMPGVTIQVKGTTTGNITDVDGNYILSSVPTNAELVFSYMGYQTQTIAVKGQSVINVVMKEDMQALDEVVVELGGARLHLDLKPVLTREKLDARILRDFSERMNADLKNVTRALLPERLNLYVLERAGLPPGKKVNAVTKEERARLAETVKDLTFGFASVGPFEEAVVTSGGVSLKELTPKCESRLVKGLYFIGEVIDADAYTGGYNLQIAFSTAAACAAAVTGGAGRHSD